MRVREGKIYRLFLRDMPGNISGTAVEADVVFPDGTVARNCRVAVPVGTRGKGDRNDVCPSQPEEAMPSPTSKPYHEVDGEQVLVLFIDGNPMKPVIIGSTEFESTAFPDVPSGPSKASGVVTKTTVRGITTFISQDGVLNIVAEDKIETAGMPDEEGVAPTSNAIRISKGNSCFYLDKEGDVFVQHKSGGMFQISSSPTDPTGLSPLFSIKDGKVTGGFSWMIDTALKIMNFTFGNFYFIIASDMDLWLLGSIDADGAFNGIIQASGVFIASAKAAVILEAAVAWMNTSATVLTKDALLEMAMILVGDAGAPTVSSNIYGSTVPVTP
jgi:hypothetical protein